MGETLRITDDLLIPEGELRFTASRSSGPGGAHGDTSSTRVTLSFDVAGSPSLSDAQRRRIERRLDNRINVDGVLKLSAGGSRSQSSNRKAVVRRFAELLREALKKERRRIPTRPTKASEKRRVEEKRRRGRKKRSRKSPPIPPED